MDLYETMKMFANYRYPLFFHEKPFNAGNYSYSIWNGFIVLQIPKIAEYDNNPVIESVLKYFPFNIPDDFHFEPIDFSFKSEPCPICAGFGYELKCPDCLGTGEVKLESDSGIEYEIECELCYGSGRIAQNSHESIHAKKYPCDNCNGIGKIDVYDNVDIDDVYCIGNKVLKMLHKLPEVMFCRTKFNHPTKGYCLKFKYGNGIFMPVKKHQNN